MRLRSLFCTAVLAAGAGLSAQAQVSAVEALTAPTTTPVGFVTNELYVSFAGQLTDVQLLTDGFATGEIYQDAAGGDVAANALFNGLVPTLASDTFVHFGAKISDAPGAVATSFAGGAVDIGGGSDRTFTTSLIDAAYFIEGGIDVSDQNDYFIGQLTFLATSNGSLDVLINAGQQQFTATYDVVNGAVVIPEPASLALMGLGGVALVARRRRVA